MHDGYCHKPAQTPGQCQRLRAQLSQKVWLEGTRYATKRRVCSLQVLPGCQLHAPWYCAVFFLLTSQRGARGRFLSDPCR